MLRRLQPDGVTIAALREPSPRPIPLTEVPPTTEEVSDESVQIERRFFNIRTLISFVIGFALLFFIATRTNIAFGDVFGTLSHADPWYIVLAFVAYYVGFPVRGLRWRVMLRDARAAEES